LGRIAYELTWFLSASRVAVRAKPDMVIGIVPSLSGAVIAWTISRLRKVPFGIVFQDLMGSAALQSGYAGGRRVASYASRLELSLARQADGIAIVADGFRIALEASGVDPARIHRVRNWAGGSPPVMSRDEARRRFGWRPNDFICLHAGNMGQKQALDNLLDAAKLVEHRGVTIVLAGDGNDRERLVAESECRGLTNVQFLGVQPAGIYESMLRAADVLLLNQRASVSDMSLPSKLSSYCAAAKPIVAAVMGTSEAGLEARRAGGIVIPPEKPHELARILVQVKSEASHEASSSGKQVHDYFERYLRKEACLAEYDNFLSRMKGLEEVSPVEALTPDGSHSRTRR
jgi:colanic acid biosynthesis glycosyl transferase WcaI